MGVVGLACLVVSALVCRSGDGVGGDPDPPNGSQGVDLGRVERGQRCCSHAIEILWFGAAISGGGSGVLSGLHGADYLLVQ